MTRDDGERRDDDDETVVRRDRFRGGPAREFLSSLDADERLFAADIAVDQAHVVMLAEQEIISQSVAGDILDALAAIEAAGHGDLPAGEDVHEAIETAVINRIGPAGGRMHTARSRNDEVAACVRYRLRQDVLALVEDLCIARASLLDLATEESETVMPGYTHLQAAQPTTVGHWAASYEGALNRDTARLLTAYNRINRSPLGAAAFAGTPFPVDRELTAELLGFDGLIENAADAVSARDFLVETTAAIATLATTLSGLAEDMIVFANRGFVELDDAYASTSSIMPQKKNPDTLELVRGRTGDATGGLQGLLTVLKGLPRAYNRDLQRTGGHTWQSIDAVAESLEVGIGAVTTASWPADTLESAAGEGFSTATGVADRLAMAGVPFRQAHEVVATAAADGDAPSISALDRAAQSVLGTSIDEIADRELLEAALDPATSVEMRNSRGGPATSALASSVERARRSLADDRETLETRKRNLDAAETHLASEVDTYV